MILEIVVAVTLIATFAILYPIWIASRYEKAEEAMRQEKASPTVSGKVPEAKELLHLNGSDELPSEFRLAGRTFILQPGSSPPSYMVCATEEDSDAERERVLAFSYTPKRRDT